MMKAKNRSVKGLPKDYDTANCMRLHELEYHFINIKGIFSFRGEELEGDMTMER
jgi:hypothetical protein